MTTVTPLFPDTASDVDPKTQPRHEGLLGLMIAIAIISQFPVCLFAGSTTWETLDKATLVIAILATELVVVLACAVAWAPKGYRLKTLAMVVLWPASFFAVGLIVW